MHKTPEFPILAAACLLLLGPRLGGAFDDFSVDAVLGGENFFDGQVLSVTGRLDLAFETQELRGQTGAIWVNFYGNHGHDREAIRAGVEAGKPVLRTASSMNLNCVKITGTINVEPSGNWNLWPVEITDISSIELADDRHCRGIDSRKHP